jgi:hypothetical protein
MVANSLAGDWSYMMGIAKQYSSYQLLDKPGNIHFWQISRFRLM